jgi:tRNA dimethylallyltransferase
MISAGLVAETKGLIQKYGTAGTAFDAIGYREIIAHLEGSLSLDEAVAAIKMNTWHYAKRQMTWFKKDKTIRWIENENAAIALVKDFLVKNEK